MSSEPIRLERRARQRFEVNQPVSVLWEGKTFSGFTQDLSGGGVFFYTEAALPEGATVELVLTMPSEVTLGETMPVRCRGRVLRSSVANPSRRVGVAVRLESYQYLPAAAQETPQFMRVSEPASAAQNPRPLPR